MDQQKTLFDDRREIGHTDPELPAKARPRLGGQNKLIYDRLKMGPATNMELERWSGSKRINSRIADVRRFLRKYENATIATRAVDTAAGLYQYEIVRN